MINGRFCILEVFRWSNVSGNGVYQRLLVFGHGQHFGPVVVVHDWPNLVAVVGKSVQTLLSRFLPNFDRMISRTRHKMLIIRRIGDAENPTGVTRQRPDEMPVRHVIDLHVAIVRSGQKPLRIRRKRQWPNRHCVTFQFVHQLGRFRIEYVDDAVNGSAGYVFTVRTLKMRRYFVHHVQIVKFDRKKVHYELTMYFEVLLSTEYYICEGFSYKQQETMPKK